MKSANIEKRKIVAYDHDEDSHVTRNKARAKVHARKVRRAMKTHAARMVDDALESYDEE